VVVCGLNQEFVALLVWPNLQACGVLAGTQDIAGSMASTAVLDAIKAGFEIYNQCNSGSSTRIRRFLLLATPPDPDAYEITDKGYVNQGAAQLNRQADVDRLFDPQPDVGVVEL
jgi:feruloyl-CoA synthase